MVNKFGCDICGSDVEFDSNTAIISKGEKLNDLCPNCAPSVQEFIQEQHDLNATREMKSTVDQSLMPIESAKDIIKSAGYIIYKRTPRRSKK